MIPHLPSPTLGSPYVTLPDGRLAYAHPIQEFKVHNDDSRILSESAQSYIICNVATHDSRQYPPWANPKYKTGSTPEGQGFGHCLVISKERVFNVVDPAATANGASLLKEMKDHFVGFWKNGGNARLLKQTKSTFDDQNSKLRTNGKTAHIESLLPTLENDFEDLAEEFRLLRPEEFEYGFHAFPDNTVGHLHMHVFPKKSSLREFSAWRHDRKTIPLEAVLELEREDMNR